MPSACSPRIIRKERKGMAIYTDLQHVHQSRTLKPRYARTQATPQAVRLDPEWDAADGDIFPGSVMSRLADGKVTLCDGTKAPAGLSGNWCAPVYGIDEVRKGAGDMDMALWVLGGDAIFAIEKPAFDTGADWNTQKTSLEAGKVVYLKSNSKGLLTPETAPQTATANTVARLVGLEGTNVILVAGLL